MIECPRCLCAYEAPACPDCGWAPARAAYRLGPKPARVPLTPRVALLRAERVLLRALAHLGAVESDPAPWHSKIEQAWRVELARDGVEQARKKRDAAALSLDPEVVAMQLAAVPRLQVPRDAGPAMEVIRE